MRTANAKMEQAMDVVDKARADLDFHDAVAAASGNPVLRIMLSSISGMMFEMMLRSHSDPSVSEPGVPHHPDIVEAIEALRCDREAAGIAIIGDQELMAAAARKTGLFLELQGMPAGFVRDPAFAIGAFESPIGGR